MNEEEQAIIDDFTEEDEVESSVNLWNYKEDKELIGVVVVVEKGNFNGQRIVVKDPHNEEIVLPELTALNTKLKDIKVEQKVKIIYEGQTKSEKSGRMYETFKVFIK